MVVEACRDLGSWHTADLRQLPNEYHVYFPISSRCSPIDVLATFALNTRPGTIRVFRALESLVKSLMFGRVTDDLRHAILNDGLLSRHEMERAQDEDEGAVACQRIKSPWTVVDVESCAAKEMAKFLASVPAT